MSAFGWLLQPAVLPWVALALRLCIGSFLNVVIHRLPKMMEREWRAECAELAGQEQEPAKEETYNLVVPRSRCPGCGHAITALENIPLASYLALRGRCSACGARIGIRYPVVELLAGLAAAYSAWRFGPSLAALGAALFVWFTIALAFIDQETGFLPDALTLLLVWIGLEIGHTSELQSHHDLVCRLLLEKKKTPDIPAFRRLSAPPLDSCRRRSQPNTGPCTDTHTRT